MSAEFRPEIDLLIQKYLTDSISEQEAEVLLAELQRHGSEDVDFRNGVSDNIWVHNILGHFYQTEKEEFPDEVLALAGEMRSATDMMDQMALEAAEAARALENVPRASNAVKSNKTKRETKNHSFRYSAFLISVVLVVVAVGVWSEFRAPFEEKKPTRIAFQPVAEVTATVGMNDADPSVAVKTGQQFESVHTKFDEGLVQFRLKNGVRLALEGPVEMRLEHAGKIFLPFGKAHAFVPPEAKGFTVETPSMSLIDHGTEFSIFVKDGDVETHTITGKTEIVAPALDKSVELTKGHAARISAAASPELFEADPAVFLDEENVQKRVSEEETEHLVAWKRATGKWNENPSLVVHFDFEGTTRTIPNVAFHGRAKVGDGRIVGARKARGRIHGKSALAFQSKRDAVRLEIREKLRSLTLSASIRIDSLDRFANCLLASENFGPGNLYWQLNHDGTLVLAIQQPEGRTVKYATPPIFPRTTWGAWYRLTTIVDTETETVVHYLDGREVARLPMNHALEIEVGPATLGNGLWKSGAVADRSFHGSIDDFMIFDRALTKEEIESAIF